MANCGGVVERDRRELRQEVGGGVVADTKTHMETAHSSVDVTGLDARGIVLLLFDQ